MNPFARTLLSPRCLTLGVLLLLAACASDTARPGDAAATTSTTILAETTATSLADRTTNSSTTSPSETTAMTDPEPADQGDADPALRCGTLTDFESAEVNEQWVVVNDGVMGGRSFGDRTFTEDTMVFAGAIDTNGGGFSSLRLPLEPGALIGHDRVVIRARADARTYMVTFDDSLPGRNRRVSFRAPIEFSTPGEWETISVDFADLFPAAFGTPVTDAPFRPDLATRMGIMLSDGIDGEFSLEIDTIEVCGPVEPT